MEGGKVFKNLMGRLYLKIFSYVGPAPILAYCSRGLNYSHLFFFFSFSSIQLPLNAGPSPHSPQRSAFRHLPLQGGRL